MVAGSALAQAAQSRGRGTRQQDGPGGLGADDAWEVYRRSAITTGAAVA
jgi:hypothetical protein